MESSASIRLSFLFLLLSVLLVELKAAFPPPRTRAPFNTPYATGSFAFESPLAQQYLVPPRLPGLDFSIQQSYAGRMNISVNPRQAAQMFFWFIPADDVRGSRDLTVWANGDACSRLVGAFQANGPITMNQGRVKPTKNPHSWTRSSHMLYLDIPLNVGFSRGRVAQRSSDDIAGFVFNFLIAFLKVFPEMEGLNLYMAGHAYSGTYISYAADKIYAYQSQLTLKLQGILLVNAFISTSTLQQHVPIASYVVENNNAFKFDAAQLRKLQETDRECGFSDYLINNLHYPPRGPFPDVTKALDPTRPAQFRDQCLIYMQMFEESSPDMNLWNIHDRPGMSDPNYTKFVYPGRADVQRAFNVAGSRHWASCGDIGQLFPNGDASPPATSKVLPNVIQRSKRVVIAHGVLDATLLTDGVKLAIQSMNWGGEQGFQQPINSEFVVAGTPSGKYHTERGLTFVEVTQSGSVIPHDYGQAGLEIFEYLLGRRPTP
ncbi:hypothetical protein PSTG_10727 [Puccinia striiformis f. sp. tritici PST-78]|uniref:Uncharacterized protein n=1 Tax=Puccinia striiformis f. sp. tritici PST-78 TaxID=1165861 RepID=A0A0L0V9G3_9BASI|nr:hypothetical protein PSTG_10727 [Puccinia striiformis f. sp. tritici PST-78]